MGFMSFCSKCFFGVCFFVVILTFVPGIPPHVTFESFVVDEAKAREGPLSKNYILDNAERLFEGHLFAPESIASRAKNEIFVSLHNGSIARIWGSDFEKVKIIANIGPGCAGSWEEHICGRPLGLRFTKERKLLVADSYLGIFAVDITTGEKERLVDPEIPIEGLKPQVIDDLDIDDNGNIYWSDASTKANLADSLIELVSGPSGRLIKYDGKSKKCEVLLSRLHFANGVQLSPDQQFVLVSETFRHRIIRYWLKGPKAGSSEVFVSGLPGMPDNIRPRKNGGYYLSLVVTRHPDKIDLYAATSMYPKLRRFFTRISFLLQKLMEYVNNLYPNRFCAVMSYKIFNLGVIAQWTDIGEAMVVEVDENGEIISSLQGTKGVLKKISETDQVGDNLFFGSPYVNFLGRLRLDSSKQPAKPSGKTDQTLPKVPEKKEEL